MTSSLDPTIESKLLQATHEIMLEEHFIRDVANVVHKRIKQREAAGETIDEIVIDSELLGYLLEQLKNLLLFESQFHEAYASILGTEYAPALDDLLIQFLQQWLSALQIAAEEPDISDYVYFSDMEELRIQFRDGLESSLQSFFRSLSQGGGQ